MKSTSLFASQRAHASGRSRRNWVVLIAVAVAFLVSYSSLKALHGMIHTFPKDTGYSFEPLMGGSMPEKREEVGTFSSSQKAGENKGGGLEETGTDSNDAEWDDDVEAEEDADIGEDKDDVVVKVEDEEEFLSDGGDQETHVDVEEEDNTEEEEDDDDNIEQEEEDNTEEEDDDDIEQEEEYVDDEAVSDDSLTRNESPSLYATENGFEVKKHTDYWGDALVWGNENLVDSEDACCKACAEYKPKTSKDAPCNVWVYCGDEELCDSNYKHCWLKYLAHPEGTSPANEGPMVGWTTGIKRKAKEPISTEKVDSGEDRSYHIVVSAQGKATHWQSRIHYYWYKKIKKQCESAGKCDMGGFTRLLHSGKPDDLMDEIPTFVAKELPKEHPHHGYIVLNRPYAFLQWIEKAKVKEKYVLMGEPDHIWLKPMPNMMQGENPAAFPFFYIEPTKDEFVNITEKFVGKLDSIEQKSRLYPIGSSPTMLSYKDMKKIIPIWYNLSLAVHEDDEAVEAWGWVQEMYAFTMSMYLAGIKDCSLYPEWMAQPPWDSDFNKYYLLHYTYGMDYTLDGQFTPGKYGEWRFDKRSYSDKPLPRNLGPPPEGMQNDLVRHLIKAFNEATDAIPDWDSYEKTGRAKVLWDGVVKEEKSQKSV